MGKGSWDRYDFLRVSPTHHIHINQSVPTWRVRIFISNPEMEFWIGSLRMRLLYVQRWKRWKKAQRSRITSMNKVVQVGFKLFREHWVVTKMVLFASSPKGTICRVYLEMLNSEDTTEVNPCEIKQWVSQRSSFWTMQGSGAKRRQPRVGSVFAQICLLRGQLHPEHVGSHMQSPQTKSGGGP